MKALEKLNSLQKVVVSGEIGKAKGKWGGAEVSVVSKLPETSSDSFYPNPKYVVSEKFYLEISWMFEQLKEIFYSDKLLDYLDKYDFFDRLAKAANRGIENDSDDCKSILLEILREAQMIYGELVSNS